MPRFSRMVVTLLVATMPAATAVLAQSSTSAVPPFRLTASAASPNLFVRLWDFLEHPWSKNGCSVDPDGRCLPQGLNLDNGCSVDPNGRCLPQGPGRVTGKNGCQVDPSGRCIR
jgi:hypothetical protein